MARSILVAGSATLTLTLTALAATVVIGAAAPVMPDRSASRPVSPLSSQSVSSLVRRSRTRPAIDSIPLQPTSEGQGASGLAVLRLASSPFSMPLTPDGHLRYQVHVTVRGLPPDPRVFGGATSYIAWATVPNLSLARALGPIGADGAATGEVEWNKFIVLVTAERSGSGKISASPAAAQAHWSGPILLKGSSPSTWMQRFQSAVLNNGGNPQW
jgi:hypothetical protein